MPGVGLCSFAALAVSLGRSAEAAPEVRAELLRAIKTRHKWYQKNFRTISDYDFDLLLSILDREALTAPSSLWLPMPLGAILAANTFNRAVIYYTCADVAARFCVPYFTEYSTSLAPVVIGFVANCHFISLDINLEDANLPIPHLDPYWNDLHEPIAEGWAELFKSNRVLFLAQTKQRSLQDDLARDLVRDRSTIPSLSVSDDTE